MNSGWLTRATGPTISAAIADTDLAGHRKAERRLLPAAALALLLAAGTAVLARSTPTPAPGPAAATPAVTVPRGQPAEAVAAPTPPALGIDWVLRNPGPDLGLHARSAVLVDVNSRQVLWQHDPYAPRASASLAKIVTAMVAVDLAALDRTVTVPPEALRVVEAEPDSTLMGLTPGETLTLRELLAGLLLNSGNDAAETVASAFTSRERFVELMNGKAAALGMRDSHFTNPTGLDEPGLRTTAYDLAIAAAEVLHRYPALAALASAREEAIDETATHKAFHLFNLVRLLRSYPGATGLKSGFTDDAGYCLIATAARGARHLAAVLLDSDPTLSEEAARLLDYGFGLPTYSAQGSWPAPLAR